MGPGQGDTSQSYRETWESKRAEVGIDPELTGTEIG
jgi:hypothetical protein